MDRPARKARRRALSRKRIDYARYLTSPSLTAMVANQTNPHTGMGNAVKKWQKAFEWTPHTITERLARPRR